MSSFNGQGRAVPPGQVRLLTKVAHLYHERRFRQTDVAAALHISQAQVSRLLKRAAEVGIVRTVVVRPQGVHTGLEQQIEEQYGLLEAVVVDVEGEEDEILAGIGSAGAAYLESTLTGGERIGISSWSQTLLSIVDRLRPLKTSGAETVVQLVGGLGVSTVQAEANRLLGELAALVGADPTFVQAPGLVSSHDTRERLLADPAMAAFADHWKALTLALVGIGSLQPSPLLRDSGNAVAADDQDELLRTGAVGDVCNRFFDGAGSLISSGLDSRTVGIAPEDFRAIPRRVGFAGSTRKHQAIEAALRGGWVNVLVTDLGTAQFLVRSDSR